MLSQKEIRSSVSKNQIINRRVFLLAAAKIVLFGGMTYRLFNLQISDREKYLFLSDKNRLREWKTPPQRGIITDYFNNVIAENDRVFQLHVNLEEVKDFNNLIVRLKNILNLNNNDLRYIYKKVSKLKPWDTLVVSDNLTWEQFSRLNLYLHELQGAEPVLSSARNYPYDKDLVHVVGYVGEASAQDIMSNEKIQSNYIPGLKVGKSGLEKSLEGDLIGRYGIKRYEVNAYGKRISQIDQVESIKGKKITTTIDAECQQFAQNLLKGQSGSICAMDIYTGEIIAMASSPTYDPNKFTHGINIKDWEEIKNNPLKPLINKSLAGLYSPGSIIKPLVALAALEYDIIKPNMEGSSVGFSWRVGCSRGSERLDWWICGCPDRLQADDGDPGWLCVFWRQEFCWAYVGFSGYLTPLVPGALQHHPCNWPRIARLMAWRSPSSRRFFVWGSGPPNGGRHGVEQW